MSCQGVTTIGVNAVQGIGSSQNLEEVKSMHVTSTPSMWDELSFSFEIWWTSHSKTAHHSTSNAR